MPPPAPPPRPTGRARFWEMSAALYARQNEWKDLSATDADAFFATLAQDLGLDVGGLAGGLRVRGGRRGRRRRSAGGGGRWGSAGTPTLFIDGQLYTGSLSADAHPVGHRGGRPAS